MDDSHIPLDEVIATHMLSHRVPRVLGAGAEARAMQALQKAIAGSPRRLLQSLADVALDLCGAGSSGVSLLEDADDKRVFRWYATAGAFAPLLWATLPRDLSPCGTVLDRQEALLMLDPERYFTPLAHIRPRVVEALLVPFDVAGEAVGTVWVATHDDEHHFDANDRRLVGELTRFAAAAYARLKSFGADDVRALSFMHQGTRADPRRRS